MFTWTQNVLLKPRKVGSPKACTMEQTPNLRISQVPFQSPSVHYQSNYTTLDICMCVLATPRNDFPSHLQKTEYQRWSAVRTEKLMKSNLFLGGKAQGTKKLLSASLSRKHSSWFFFILLCAKCTISTTRYLADSVVL